MKITRSVLILFILCSFAAVNAQSIKWMKDFGKAQAAAKKAKKPMVVDFYADW